MAASMASRSRLWLKLLELKSLEKHGRCLQTSISCCLQSEQEVTSKVTSPPSAVTSAKVKKISKAMQAYIDRARKHDELMKVETEEYELGKRHLANIMGADPNAFGQDDIDKAIEYLLPSGIFDKKARPLMKHPLEVFPSRKAAQFGMDGRPFHYLFYTGKPIFFEIMNKAALCLDELNRVEDSMIAKGIREAPPHEQWSGKGSEWITVKELEKRIVEPVDEREYLQFLMLMERLLDHPYSNRVKEFLEKYRIELITQDTAQSIPEPITAENGRRYVEAVGKKKWSQATVQLWDQGSGKVTINDHHNILFFDGIQDREQIMFPLQLTGKLGEMDMVVRLEQLYDIGSRGHLMSSSGDSGGPSTKAGAIRLALSRALCSFVDAATVEKLRIAGLLQEDRRWKERKKPGQEKARKKWTWKKR